MNESEDVTVLSKARRLVNIELRAIALQRRRLATSDPEDDTFDLRWWTDLQFFIVALSRLRRNAHIALLDNDAAPFVRAALDRFDAAVPNLLVMRNVGEHGDEYATDSRRRHLKSIDSRQYEVGRWDGRHYEWLEHTLNVDDALAAAERLYHDLPGGPPLAT